MHARVCMSCKDLTRRMKMMNNNETQKIEINLLHEYEWAMENVLSNVKYYKAANTGLNQIDIETHRFSNSIEM